MAGPGAEEGGHPKPGRIDRSGRLGEGRRGGILASALSIGLALGPWRYESRMTKVLVIDDSRNVTDLVGETL